MYLGQSKEEMLKEINKIRDDKKTPKKPKK